MVEIYKRIYMQKKMNEKEKVNEVVIKQSNIKQFGLLILEVIMAILSLAFTIFGDLIVKLIGGRRFITCN